MNGPTSGTTRAKSRRLVDWNTQGRLFRSDHVQMTSSPWGFVVPKWDPHAFRGIPACCARRRRRRARNAPRPGAAGGLRVTTAAPLRNGPRPAREKHHRLGGRAAPLSAATTNGEAGHVGRRRKRSSATQKARWAAFRTGKAFAGGNRARRRRQKRRRRKAGVSLTWAGVASGGLRLS
jgi:hypothetical protein